MSPEFLAPSRDALKKNRLEALRDRARMLSSTRDFFASRNVLEVDCPLLTKGASIDAHIDLISGHNGPEIRYLHSSPEYGMKRLLSEGIGDIYQLSHVFRAEEEGHKHNPEFMMAEWYRMGFSFQQMIDETCEYIRLFLGPLPIEILSYRELFQRYAGIDYVHASIEELIEHLKNHNITVYPEVIDEGKDAVLNLILGTLIEPHLGEKSLFVLSYYPSTQAALAQVLCCDDEMVAQRFEVYHRGYELANGYKELADALEQRARFVESNEQRRGLGKNTLPVDESFLACLEQGLPECCGVAVGFDRLMMLRLKAEHIKEVVPFSWSTA